MDFSLKSPAYISQIAMKLGELWDSGLLVHHICAAFDPLVLFRHLGGDFVHLSQNGM